MCGPTMLNDLTWFCCPLMTVQGPTKRMPRYQTYNILIVIFTEIISVLVFQSRNLLLNQFGGNSLPVFEQKRKPFTIIYWGSTSIF